MYDQDKQNIFYLVPEKVLVDLIEAANDIKKLQETIERREDNSRTLGGYIEEDQAMKILKRRKTWFWNKRKSGELTGKKAAGRWYYNIEDINKYIQNGRTV